MFTHTFKEASANTAHLPEDNSSFSDLLVD
jgi:hypothetical protein